MATGLSVPAGPGDAAALQSGQRRAARREAWQLHTRWPRFRGNVLAAFPRKRSRG